MLEIDVLNLEPKVVNLYRFVNGNCVIIHVVGLYCKFRFGLWVSRLSAPGS